MTGTNPAIGGSSDQNYTREALLDAIKQKRDWTQAHRIPKPEMAQAIADGTGENQSIFIRGNHKTQGDVAPRQMLTAICSEDYSKLSPADGSGRLLLAQDLVRPDNPLTSRVIVNRLWHYLFGDGIVASVDNFGVLGEKPTNPELLDHLASKFVADGWSLKSMMRYMVTSSAYQMSSATDPQQDEKDPGNRLLHRASVRRLTSEAIRDAILADSGRLDPTMYGPSVPIYLTPFMEGRGRPSNSGPLDGNGRRSVYIEVRRNFLSPMMLTFDTPVPFNTIGRRSVSNVPSQALMLMNSPFVAEEADRWAKQLLADHASDAERLQQLYLQAFARIPSDKESELTLDFVTRQRQLLADSGVAEAETEQQAWRDLCHVLINSKEYYFLN